MLKFETNTRDNTGVQGLRKDIGALIRQLRAQRGVTRKQLAAHSGISERYLADLEGGSANASVGVLWQIGGALDVSINELLPDPSIPVIKHPPLQKLLQQLTVEQQIRAHSMLRKKLRENRDELRGVALIGLRGAGKTTFGNLLSSEFDVPFVRLGQLIEQLGGITTQELISQGGQKAYRQLEHDALNYVLDGEHPMVLEAGGSIVSQSEPFTRLLNSFYTVWVKARPEDHMSRVIAQGDFRPMSGNRKAMIDLKRILAAREADYRAANYILETSGRTVEDCYSELVQTCREHF